MIEYRCRSGDSCVARTPDGGALVTGPTLCSRCADDIQKCLEQLPHLITALQTMKGTWGGVSYEARVQSSKEPPTPLHLHVVDLIDRINQSIDATEDYRIVDLITQADGVTRALDIRHVHKRASEAVGFQPTWQRRHAPCWECGLPTLGTWVGSDVIQCSNEECLAQCSLDEYTQHCMRNR
ncbi:DNA binding protein [Mycobacterium phage Quink]|uniref:Uncharacterized protein n=8 Tax=Kostyavirus TaxID=1623284 RepID=G1DI32_9CAUD|nr:DNA binding protein [Mycobacterium phage Murphy]YP_008051723.1 DNA binding protein [Mycobacterium phage Dumbo]YP_008052031.1 DNA binding protein [Mycobacterium phage Phrux]YP_008052274.1 DNA binding protein [Mycobacterium phage Phaux]YP_008409491.1 DNA binding protein [Mycobacterium phage DrDrey]YP_008410112.1 DNA binding protein [Mycobacterium phage Contagion]YP_008531177.1 DNA binding protein [Mycobacterium phage Quink]YP_008859532.1 DNA binding protein [Mycobacterium phage Bruin]YP_00